MFRSRTLFILGAGASVEAGLPTSIQLKADIAKRLDLRTNPGRRSLEDSDIAYILRQYLARTQRGAEVNDYYHSARAISSAMPQALSIDNYLDAHRDERIELCGKLGIARSILDAEKQFMLFISEQQNQKLSFDRLTETWYHAFFQKLTEKIPKSKIDDVFANLSFIVFNYDRCIEHFLVNALVNYYLISKDDARSLVSGLRVIHPYGTVGDLPWYRKNPKSVPFGGSEVGPIDIIDLASQIKTFTERVEDQAALDVLRGEVQNADVIVFLGFAFHEQNMDLIRPGGACEAKSVFATALGISKSDCEVVESEIARFIGKKPQNIIVKLRNDLTCARLFNEFWRSLTFG